jgi:hypothetical protein
MDQEYFSGEKFPDHDSRRRAPSLRSETFSSSPRIREDDTKYSHERHKYFSAKVFFY